ncbi:MAG TPA: DUF3798 domain-containing protein [Tissierellia bacterium]|nr:DUF3798 domain-containing protein [Tissierellia bacterium]
MAILTGTVSQNEEEYRAAQNVLEKYGPEHVILMTYPDKFTEEQETTISNIVSLAQTPGIKAMVIVQAVPGVSAGIAQAREVNPDLLVIAGTPGEDPPEIASQADIVLAADELAMGTTVMEQAVAMGAKTFIHYSFPRHMSYALLAARRDLLKENAEKAGVTFLEVDAPDPTGDAGLPGAQQFIMEDVPKQVQEHGKDTAFFSTNCGMQIPLIKQVVETGALYPQPCCPSPFHGFPAALDIEVPDDKKGDIPYMIETVRGIMAERNMTGRTSTWPVPVAMMFVEAGAEYAKEFTQGKITTKDDYDHLKTLMEAYIADVYPEGADVTITPLEESGNSYPNFLMVLVGFLNL